MLVSELISFARGSELKKLSIATYDDSTIIAYINLGLVELYKRFNLSTQEVLIDLEDNITTYTLPADCMIVQEVYNENGEMYNLNDEDDQLSILTPSWNELQVPNPETGATISVIYLANPSFLTQVTDVVPIPMQLLEAMLHYIGYRAHSAQDGNIQAENNTHYTRFESSCRRVESLGLITSDDVLSTFKLDKRGFV